MRRIFLVAAALLGGHVLLFFLLDEYRELALHLGMIFPLGHEIADVFPVMGTGWDPSHSRGRNRRSSRPSRSSAAVGRFVTKVNPHMIRFHG